MKLYTEEDIAKAVMFGRWGRIEKEVYLDFLNSLTAIEIPSDEQIKHYFSKSNRTPWDIAALNGALVIVEQIKKGRFLKESKGDGK